MEQKQTKETKRRRHAAWVGMAVLYAGAGLMCWGLGLLCGPLGLIAAGLTVAVTGASLIPMRLEGGEDDG